MATLDLYCNLNMAKCKQEIGEEYTNLITFTIIIFKSCHLRRLEIPYKNANTTITRFTSRPAKCLA
jgi:hypothetical protein